MKLQDIAQNIMMNGPSRVVINSDGEATSSIRAREALRVEPDIIFIRDDGWSLAAPRSFEAVAYNMWKGEWIGFIRRPNMYAEYMNVYEIITEGLKDE